MIHHGDCIEVMPSIASDSIDAIVADPPYGIGFMGHEWDQPGEHGPLRAGAGHSPGHPRERERRAAGDESFTSMEACRYDLSPSANLRYQAWSEAWAREALRIAKPGAHLLAFGGTRTYHRLASAIEDAGWEIRDCLVWAYASGFPKSLDVSRAIDRAAGAEREVIGHTDPHSPRTAMARSIMGSPSQNGPGDGTTITAPATPDAARWSGWGTALKPAWEPIVLARKPMRGTVAANVLEHGTGALNIDGTRIVYQGDSDRLSAFPGGRPTSKPSAAIAATPDAGRNLERVDSGAQQSERGRWPANVVLTDPIFDGDVEGVVGGGEQAGGGNPRWASPEASEGQYGGYAGGETGKVPVDTAGSYSRFFLIGKASRADREPIMGGLVAQKPPGWSNGEQSPGTFQSQPTPARENVHPTVKPVELMRHLVRLVTPPGGTVLDPFLGSGTTAIAAELEGFAWIGIEREAKYVEIAHARLEGVQKGLGLEVEAPTARRSRSKGHWPAKRSPHAVEGWGFSGGQDGLFERHDETVP